MDLKHISKGKINLIKKQKSEAEIVKAEQLVQVRKDLKDERRRLKKVYS
jgi:hypothetical protein